MTPFCASCIVRVPVVRTEVNGRRVWLCLDCYDGADCSLPVHVHECEHRFYAQRVRNIVQRDPELSVVDIAERMGEYVDKEAGNTSAGAQRVYRMVREIKRDRRIGAGEGERA